MSQVDLNFISRDPPATVDRSSTTSNGELAGGPPRRRNRRRNRRPAEGAHVVPSNDDFRPSDLATPVDRPALRAAATSGITIPDSPASPASPPSRRRDVKRGKRLPPPSPGGGTQALNHPGQSELATTATGSDSSPITSSSNASAKDERRAPRNPSRGKFGAKLTTENALSTRVGEQESPSSKLSNSGNKRRDKPKAPGAPTESQDLTTRLIYSFTHKDDALDCPICFNSIHPAQPIWSCSPNSAENADTYCWTSFHLKCIRPWASKSISNLSTM